MSLQDLPLLNTYSPLCNSSLKHYMIHAPPTSVPNHKETFTVHIAMKTLCPYHKHNLLLTTAMYM